MPTEVHSVGIWKQVIANKRQRRENATVMHQHFSESLVMGSRMKLTRQRYSGQGTKVVTERWEKIPR